MVGLACSSYLTNLTIKKSVWSVRSLIGTGYAGTSREALVRLPQLYACKQNIFLLPLSQLVNSFSSEKQVRMIQGCSTWPQQYGEGKVTVETLA
jgi:hypothetical protein